MHMFAPAHTRDDQHATAPCERSARRLDARFGCRSSTSKAMLRSEKKKGEEAVRDDVFQKNVEKEGQVYRHDALAGTHNTQKKA